jgi:hypothetical protein
MVTVHTHKLRHCVIAALATLVLSAGPGGAFADDGEKAEGKSKKKQDVSVQVIAAERKVILGGPVSVQCQASGGNAPVVIGFSQEEQGALGQPANPLAFSDLNAAFSSEKVWDSLSEELEKAGLSQAQREAIKKSLEGSLDAADKGKPAQVTISGVCRIIGPDGKVEEIDLNAEDIDWQEVAFPGITSSMVFAGPDQGKRFFIGVECDAEQDKVVVKAVMDDTPAKEAGIQVGDVLLRANGRKLGSVSALTKEVQEAGENESALSLSLVRDGKKKTIKVVPKAREAVGFSVQDWSSAFHTLPGAGKADIEALEEQIKAISKKLDKIQRDIDEIKNRR